MTDIDQAGSGVHATHVRGLLALRGLPLFSEVPAGEALAVADRVAEQSLSEGEVLCREGTEATDVFVLVDGRVELTRGGGVVAVLEPGELFGEAALLDGEPHLATARAVTAARVLRIDRAGFHELLDTCPPLQQAVIRALAARMRRALDLADGR